MYLFLGYLQLFTCSSVLLRCTIISDQRGNPMEYAAAAAISAVICYMLVTTHRKRSRGKRRARRRARNLGHQLAWGIFMRRPKLQRLEYRGDAAESDKKSR